MLKQICLAILLAVVSFNCFAKEKPITISKLKAIDDVWFLKQTMEETHPNLYYTLPEEQFANSLNQIIAQMGDEVNVDSLTAWLMPVVNQLNDGHTRVSKSYSAKVSNENDSYFPLKLDLKNYTVAQSNEFNIAQGAEVKSINGMELAEMVEQILPMIDGEKQFNRLAELEYTFPYWLNRVYGQQKQFVLKGTTNGQPFEQTLKGVSTSNFFTVYDGDIEASFNIYDDQNKVAYLKLSLFGSSKNYYRFIDESFAKMNIKGVDQLIIDIRDNPGGNTNLAEYIFQYLAQDSYRFYQTTTMKYSKLSRRMYRQYGWRKPYLLPIMICTKPYWKTKGEKVNANHELFIYRKEEELYKGDVYLITSHYCYSTADDFARVFKYHNMGTIVGEETGGLKASYGDVLYFSLPNSQIQCGCSYQHYSGLDLGDNPTDGVKPDIYVDGDNFTCEEVMEFVSSQIDLVMH